MNSIMIEIICQWIILIVYILPCSIAWYTMFNDFCFNVSMSSVTSEDAFDVIFYTILIIGGFGLFYGAGCFDRIF